LSQEVLEEDRMGRTKKRVADRRLEVTGMIVVPRDPRAWERDLIIERLRRAIDEHRDRGADPHGGRDGA
jgi:hypothetical protein